MVPRIHVFGPFELERNGDVRVLRKHGIRMKVQGQPLDILAYLVERPAQVVSRQDLQELLWGGEVHVDFERGLNTAVKRLRAVLGDDPAQPRYIETVARTGYVFVANVEEVVPSAQPPSFTLPAPPSRRWILSGAAAIAASAGVGAYIWKTRARDLQLRKLSFDLGNISNVFFTADGQSVVYSAHWSGGARWQTFLHRLDESRPQPLPFDGLGVAAVSSSDELLLFDFAAHSKSRGALVRASLDGARPQFLDEHVLSVDWAHDGKHIACVRFDGSEDRVEYPAGRTMHVSPGNLGPVRVAPTDAAIAVLEHNVRGDTGGYVLLLERGRAAKKLMERWPHMVSIAWHPNGQEVWFTGSRDGTTNALWAVDRGGSIRMVGLPGMADSTFDLHRNGRVTFIKNHARLESGLHLPDDAPPREITHLGWTRAVGLANGGRAVLFDESGEGVGNHYRVFIYEAANRQVRELGPGVALAITPDASVALSMHPEHRDQLTLISLTDGRRMQIPSRGWRYDTAVFFPDAKRIAACARPMDRPGSPSVVIVHSLGEGPVSILPFSERVTNVRVSPKGDFVAAGRNRISKWAQWDSRPEVVEPEIPANLIGFAPGGRYVVRAPEWESGPSAKLHTMRPDGTLERPALFHLGPSDSKGILRLNLALLSPDGTAAAYVAHRAHAELFLAEGLH
ncbi:MAG: winged helix-turn-helix domain-containing protein [Bryobacteraceae bacterium]